MEGKHRLALKIGQFMSYYKRKMSIKKFYKTWPEIKFHVSLPLQKLKHNLYCKTKSLTQAYYIEYVIAKLSKYVKNCM